MNNSSFVLNGPEKEELAARLRSRMLPAEDVRRARLILMLADGNSYTVIQEALRCNRSYISQWKQRFERDGLAGLYSRHKGSKPSKKAMKLEVKILARVQQKPSDGSTHWSVRKLAREVGTNPMRVSRVLRRARLKPHRIERYIASNDPEFEEKAADIIGLYMNPPQHAAVFCVDEKTAIQALDRLNPVLPIVAPAAPNGTGFEYYRHGTLSLYAALNTETGEVVGKTAQRHTSEEFVAFLSEIVAHQPKGREIHIIADNLSAHKTKRVAAFLAEHDNLEMHYTPTYSSWLNQVELWFNKVERDVIARGVFTSTPDLRRKLMRYIREGNKNPKPFKWSYSDVRRRIQVWS